MKKSKIAFVTLALNFFSGAIAHAQLNIPLTNVTLAYPSISAVTIQLGGTTRSGLPTPFILPAALVPDSLLWFCIDPLQTIYYSGSGQPAGSQLNYASTNPSDFDKWTPAAPGLSAGRIQNLADLFTAYAPTRTNQLIGGALQIAIWEIVNEFDGNPFSLSGGQMRTTAGDALMLTTAQNMLNSLSTPAVANHGNTSFLDYLIDGTYTAAGHDTVLVQDLVGFTPVPESSSFAIGITGILLTAMVWKIRGRKIRATV